MQGITVDALTYVSDVDVFKNQKRFASDANVLGNIFEPSPIGNEFNKVKVKERNKTN